MHRLAWSRPPTSSASPLREFTLPDNVSQLFKTSSAALRCSEPHTSHASWPARESRVKIASRSPAADFATASAVPPPPAPEASYRRVEITVEREVLTVSYPAGASLTARCALCATEVLLLSAEAAAVAARTSPREIYRRLESGNLHFQELPTGKIYICSASLRNAYPAASTCPASSDGAT